MNRPNRQISYKISFIIISILLITAPDGARGWTVPRRLTDRQFMMDPQAVSNGRNIYLLAWGYAGADFRFLSSWNCGFSWSDPVQPADTFYGGSNTPDIEYTPNGLIHVVWTGQYEGVFWSQVFHQSSSDGGKHWSNRHQVFNNRAASISFPRLASRGDTLFLVCADGFNMLFFRSFDYGLTWHDSTVADIDTNMAYPPTILYSQEKLHLIYELNLYEDSAGYKIYYSQSPDFGLTWSHRVPISSVEIGPPYYHSQFPSAYADDEGHIVAAWFDYQYGSYCGTSGDILGRVSTDNGTTWLPETRLTYTQSGEASSCLILNDILYVAWMDDWPMGCDNPKIVLATSSDWGVTWSQPNIISGNVRIIERAPFLIYSFEGSDALIHCFYDVYDPSYGTDIYYIRDKSFFSDRLPMPNPQPVVLDIKASPCIFYSSTVISFVNSKGDGAELEIYDILGRKVWSNSVMGKEGNIIWDAKDTNGHGISSGIYFIRATSGDKITNVKVTYIK